MYMNFLKSVGYLRRVGVDDADVLSAIRPLQDDLLHVGAHDRHARGLELVVDEAEELRNVAHELLADALARAVNGELQAWSRVEHGCREHGDTDCFSEPAKKEGFNQTGSQGNNQIKKNRDAGQGSTYSCPCRMH